MKYLLFTVVIALLAIQFIRPARDQGGQETDGNIARTLHMPGDVYSLFKGACFDCHSNNAIYPWYADIQPVGWLIAQDIADGKSNLNFSEIGSLSPRRQISKLQNIENRLKDGTMPLFTYRIMHPSGRLTREEKELMIAWIQKTTSGIRDGK